MMEVSLTGYRNEHPPATRAGFVAHAASLALPDIHRLIHDAKPCSEIATFRVAQTVRRHYRSSGTSRRLLAWATPCAPSTRCSPRHDGGRTAAVALQTRCDGRSCAL